MTTPADVTALLGELSPAPGYAEIQRVGAERGILRINIPGLESQFKQLAQAEQEDGCHQDH